MKRDAKKGGGGLYVYGKHPVEELLANNAKNVGEIAIVDYQSEGGFAELVRTAKKEGISVRSVSKHEAIAMVGEVNTQRVLARVKKFTYWNMREWAEQYGAAEQGSVMVLDKLEDVHNFGAILRSAAAAGVSGVFVANAGQVAMSGGVFKTSAGAALKVPIVEVSNIADTLRKLKELGFWVYAVDLEDGVSTSMYAQEFDKKTALVVGGEGVGVSHIVRDTADFLVHIPMENNIESLNVSVAAALSMYEWKRQQS